MNLFATTMLAEVDGLYEEHVRVMTIGRTRRAAEEGRATRSRKRGRRRRATTA